MITLENGKLKVVLDENDGLTVISLKYGDREFIALDEAKRAAGRTYGIPILFPTPNRVKGDRYNFNGKEIKGKMHGFLRHMDLSFATIGEDSVEVKIPFDESNEYFPYDAELIIRLFIENNSLKWIFMMENKGDEDLSYGLALHPFFKKDENLKVRVNLAKRVELDSECYPIGTLNDDASLPEEVSKIKEDQLFLCSDSIKAEMDYPDVKMKMSASDDFKFAVIYTSPEWPFICVEPQTMLTNAHNMYSEGYEELSNLIIIKGKERHESFVTLSFEEDNSMEEVKKFCFSEEAVEQNAGEGVTRKILSYSDNMMVCELHFDKGAVGAPHRHIHEQITYVISGVFEVTVDGETATLKAGDTVYEKRGVLHGMTCIEEGTIIDIFSPKRDDFLAK